MADPVEGMEKLSLSDPAHGNHGNHGNKLSDPTAPAYDPNPSIEQYTEQHHGNHEQHGNHGNNEHHGKHGNNDQHHGNHGNSDQHHGNHGNSEYQDYKPHLYTGPEKQYKEYGHHQGYYQHYGNHGNQHYQHYGNHGNHGNHGNQQQQYNHYRQNLDEDEKFKIIVRHLNYKTTEDTVGDHFSQFGQVRTVNIKKDPDGSSRGFGFVVFESEESLSAAIANENQRIDNHDVIVTKPIPLSEKMKTNMLFVGGLHREITEEQLRGYFSTFGEITEIIFVENRQTNERKGFCFVHFKENEAVERITEGKNPPLAAVHNIDEYKLDCKKKFPDSHPEQRKLKQRQAAKRYFGGYGPPNPGYGPPPDYYQGGYGGYNDYNGGGGYHNGGGGYHNGGGFEQGGYQNTYDQYNNNYQRGRGRGGYKPY